MTEIFVTNFNPRFTGVSATTAGVLRAQLARGLDATLVGNPLPGCPAPISARAAMRASVRPVDRPFAIWHVRRNPEMRIGLWARDVLRKPIRLVFTSAAQRHHSLYPRWLISRMDAVIATTEEAARYVPHVRAVVPHGIDTARFCPAPDRAAVWKDLGFGGKVGVATVGRIRPEKGTDRFVDAMIAALPGLPGVVALVVGRATPEHRRFETDLHARVAEAGLTDRIKFTGERPPDDLPALMRGISLLVALPRYEGYGMTPLEAMASGTPFVATDAGYYRAFSQEGRCGTVLECDAPQTAADAVAALLSDPARLSVMAHAARQAAQDQHSIDTEAAGAAAVYDALWQRG